MEPDLTEERLRALIDERTRDLPPAERVRVADLVRSRLKARRRATRYPTVGSLVRTLRPQYVRTPALDLLDGELQAVADGKVRRLAVFMPPQEGKSETITIGGPLWMLLRNPELRLAIASYEVNIATRFGSAIRDEVIARGSGSTRHPNPSDLDVLSLSVREDYAAASRWRVGEGGGGVVSVGIGGALTSRPVDGLFIDDPIKDAAHAASPVLRENAWQWWQAVALTRLPPEGFVVVVMTRWHEDDLGGRLIEQERALPEHERTWRFVSVPAIAEPPDPTGKRLPDALGREPGQVIVSARGRTAEDFRRTRLAVGERVWGALYQQNPTPTEGGIFAWASISRNRRSPDELNLLQPGFVVRRVAVDPPGGAGSRDEAGIVAAARGTDGRAYILEDASGQLSAGQWPRKAFVTALRWGADEVVYEQNLAGATMRKIMRDAWDRIVRQARTVSRHRELLDGEAALIAAAAELAAAERGLPTELVDTADAAPILDELRELDPHVDSVLSLPETGLRVRGVTATQGKRIRATPIAVAYEQNRVSHVGVFPELENQLTTWVEGEDSPDRMDGLVWVLTDLLETRRSGHAAPPPTSLPTGADTFRRS